MSSISRPLLCVALLVLPLALHGRSTFAQEREESEASSPTAKIHGDYEAQLTRIESMRSDVNLEDGLEDDPERVERALITEFEALVAHWYGTTWGLGAPQTKRPGEGKINCGMFVARTLADAGFIIKESKLQRQPAELIIKSLTTKEHITRWRNRSVETFIEDMKELGPGLYIIGLDFHVGYVLVREDLDVRFIHASYVTHDVLDEDASKAEPIVSSKYRVVGRIFTAPMLRKWQRGERIEVRGSW